jgi:hypothetical protein
MSLGDKAFARQGRAQSRPGNCRKPIEANGAEASRNAHSTTGRSQMRQSETPASHQQLPVYSRVKPEDFRKKSSFINIRR